MCGYTDLVRCVLVYGVVRLGWCGNLMQAETQQKLKQVTSVGLSLFNYQDDARSDKRKDSRIQLFRK